MKLENYKLMFLGKPDIKVQNNKHCNSKKFQDIKYGNILFQSPLPLP